MLFLTDRILFLYPTNQIHFYQLPKIVTVYMLCITISMRSVFIFLLFFCVEKKKHSAVRQIYKKCKNLIEIS